MGLLDQLWDRYAAHVPYARTFVELAQGKFRNDHVGGRPLKGRGGIEPLAVFFEWRGGAAGRRLLGAGGVGPARRVRLSWRAPRRHLSGETGWPPLVHPAALV